MMAKVSTEEHKLAAERMAQEAADGNGARCVEGEAMFFLEDTEARVPGHIYSHTGLNEVKLSGICEYHFDDWFKEEDE